MGVTEPGRKRLRYVKIVVPSTALGKLLEKK
jgi:hypothetical protein